MVQRFVPVILLMVLAGCSTTPLDQAGDAEVMEASVMPAKDALERSPALDLLDRANLAIAENNFAAASRLLERAITIEPDSSWLYYQLAKLRLRQGNAFAAEGLAKKALRLAPEDVSYIKEVSRLIEVSLNRQGAGVSF